MKYIYGKNVFLTGGSSGIGLATAELLASQGYIVYAGSRNPAAVSRSFSEGGEIHPVTIDVCDDTSVAKAAEATLAAADIGIIIHCAGIGIACPAEDFPPTAVNKLFETNLLGVLRVNSHFLPHLRKRGSGLCIMVGSVAGIFAIPFQAHYSASKAALDSYTKALRMELKNFGVQASLVMPGDTATPFTGARSYQIAESSPYYQACCAAVTKMAQDEQKWPPTRFRSAYYLKNLSQAETRCPLYGRAQLSSAGFFAALAARKLN